MDYRELIDVLEANGIPYGTWGAGEAKTVANLLIELNTGDCRFEKVENRFTRVVDVCAVNVVCYINETDTEWVLREDRQEFVDGRIRRRQLDTSIGEKMKPDEEPEVAVRRALHEELHIDEHEEVYISSRGMKLVEPESAYSYPGLPALYRKHYFEVNLLPHHFCAHGFVEREKDKTNYYVWEQRPKPSAPT